MEIQTNMQQRPRRRLSRGKICLFGTLGVVLVAVAAFGVWGYSSAYRQYSGRAATVIIPAGATDDAVCDSLTKHLGDYGVTVYRLWALRGGDPAQAKGVYTIQAGDKAWSVAGRLKDGRSSTVRVTFNNVRLVSDLAERISATFPWSAQDFLVACDSVLPGKGFKYEEYPAAFWPNTYEFYASATPVQVVSKLVEERNRFWDTQGRRDKAAAMGLTPVQVVTVASIVEEESANAAERPIIARLYLNRLERGMKLQADPTVKFALGDFSLKRIYNKHTQVESPYNTYMVTGLPPGPIRIPDGATIDAVLDAPANDYIYMCAKPDGSGTHNFTDSYDRHLVNAARYREWLNEQGL